MRTCSVSPTVSADGYRLPCTDALPCTDQYLGEMEVGADEETVVDRHIVTALDGVGRCDDGSRQHREHRFVMRLQIQSTVHPPPSSVHRIHAEAER